MAPKTSGVARRRPPRTHPLITNFESVAPRGGTFKAIRDTHRGNFVRRDCAELLIVKVASDPVPAWRNENADGASQLNAAFAERSLAELVPPISFFLASMMSFNRCHSKLSLVQTFVYATYTCEGDNMKGAK